MPHHNTNRSHRRRHNTAKAKATRITRKTAKRHVAIDKVEREIARIETLIHDCPPLQTDCWWWWWNNIRNWQRTRNVLLAERDTLLSIHYSATTP